MSPLGAWPWLLLDQRMGWELLLSPAPLKGCGISVLPLPFAPPQVLASGCESESSAAAQTRGVPLFAWLSSQVAAHLQLRTSCRSKAADWPAKKPKHIEDQGVACARAE